MPKYRATYKCQICNELIPDETVQEVEDRELLGIRLIHTQNQQVVGSRNLCTASMYKTHFCSNGCCGLAIFAGYIKD